MVKQTRELLHDEIAADTKKLESLQAFEEAMSEELLRKVHHKDAT